LKPLNQKIDPATLLARWPREIPVAAAIAGDGVARWSVVGIPSRTVFTLQEVLATVSTPQPVAFSEEANLNQNQPPFTSGWIGSISYGYGLSLPQNGFAHRFRTEQLSSRPTGRWEPLVFQRLDHALAFDHKQNQWWLTGGDGGDGGAILAKLLQGLKQNAFYPSNPVPTFSIAPPAPQQSRQTYESWVRRALQYIRAGDVYQVNLAHHLLAPFQGDALSWFAARLAAAAPRYATYISWAHDNQLRVIASLSPELFLAYDPHRRELQTRPMKGTRLPTQGAREELTLSTKDRAELAMIVDLLRNDLGCVSELGSVQVVEPHVIETHGNASQASHAENSPPFTESMHHAALGATAPEPPRAVLQAVATIRGTLRKELTITDALHACFPGGSVTGAPKSRAMQIIDEIEPAPREHYCGSSGFIADSGAVRLNINIRTAMIQGVPASPQAFAPGSTLTYPVGAGIVADSDPASEWLETLMKAAPLG